jgi:hypothetical protein
MNSNEARLVLQATYRLLDNGNGLTPADTVCAALGKPPGDPHTTGVLASLYEDGYIGGWTTDQNSAPMLIKGTKTGRREVGG